MSNVTFGKGKLAGKGIYANKDFKKGEVVIKYKLKTLSREGYNVLPRTEIMFTHTQYGVLESVF